MTTKSTKLSSNMSQLYSFEIWKLLEDESLSHHHNRYIFSLSAFYKVDQLDLLLLLSVGYSMAAEGQMKGKCVSLISGLTKLMC